MFDCEPLRRKKMESNNASLLDVDPMVSADNAEKDLPLEPQNDDAEAEVKPVFEAQTEDNPLSVQTTKPAAQNIVIGVHPPTPQALKDLPELDFDDFLRKMRSTQAYILTRYFRSFLREFQSRHWKPGQQVKIVNDFLNFIVGKMGETDIWRNASEMELDIAREGMEKLVMTKIYPWTFTPGGSDDAKTDKRLERKIRLHSWVEEQHLDIPPALRQLGYINLAKQELVKMNEYKAPRDKIICILNSCKILLGFVEQHQQNASADDFVPLLIFTVMRANPPKLMSNVQFIQRFRNPNKLSSEAGYYLTNLMGAISFIENIGVKSLTIDPVDYDHHIAVVLSENADLELEAEESAQHNSIPKSEEPVSPTDGVISKVSSGAGSISTFLQKPLSVLGKLLDPISPVTDTTFGASLPGALDSRLRSSSENPLANRPISQDSKRPASASAQPGNPSARRFSHRSSASRQHSPERAGPAELSLPSRRLSSHDISLPGSKSPSRPSSGYLTPAGAAQSLQSELETKQTMSTKDQALLHDYELQMAMALSLSLQDADGGSASSHANATQQPDLMNFSSDSEAETKKAAPEEARPAAESIDRASTPANDANPNETSLI